MPGSSAARLFCVSVYCFYLVIEVLL